MAGDRHMLTVYIGFDTREPIAYDVAKYSIEKHASGPVNIHPLKLADLNEQKLITRELVRQDGKFYDVISQAPASTEFAISRFLAVLLQRSGWAIFMDCDMVFVDDIYDIFKELDPKYAIQCVQHNHVPTETLKMDGQPQTVYNRKNWSSFFAINADHPSNRRLTFDMINTLPGRDLHAFCWLKDEEVGALSPGWNWLVNAQERPAQLHNAHLTLGGPWFPDWTPQPNDELWLKYHDMMLAEQASPARKQA
jgi:hypothetical protein